MNARQATQTARQVQQALTRLGFCYEAKDGHVVEISYKSIQIVGDAYLLLEVDPLRLPRRVSIPDLIHDKVLHHLTAVVGKPVKRLNTTGLTYCVVLNPPKRKRLPKVIHLDLDARPPGDYMIPIGEGRKGPVWRSLLETGHILVGGESGSGKSTWLNAMLIALLDAHTPDTLRLAIVDPKGVEFSWCAGLAHLALPVATMVDAASEVTAWLAREMDRRGPLFAGLFARNLASYNAKAEAPLPLIVAVIDEVTDIALQAGLRSGFYTDLVRLASKGRALGIMLVLATQNPKAEVLNTLIRGNCSTRIAFRTATAVHSRIILGDVTEGDGAHRIPRTIRGRMKAHLDAGLVDLQGYLVDDDELLALAQRHGGCQPPTLSADEAALVRFAVDKLDGAFIVGKLARAFQGELTHHYIKTLARRWEHEGLLTKPAHATDARRVTPELLARLRGEACPELHPEHSRRGSRRACPGDGFCRTGAQGEQAE